VESLAESWLSTGAAFSAIETPFFAQGTPTSFVVKHIK